MGPAYHDDNKPESKCDVCRWLSWDILCVAGCLVAGMMLAGYGGAEATGYRPTRPDLETPGPVGTRSIMERVPDKDRVAVAKECFDSVERINKQRVELWDKEAQSFRPGDHSLSLAQAKATEYAGFGLLACALVLLVRYVVITIYEAS